MNRIELAMEIGKGISGAVFSEDRFYRYALWRIWDREKPAVIFVGLNPSTANELRDDPTIVRLASFAKNWGYGGLYAGNLYAMVTKDPLDLYTRSRRFNPVGKLNDQALDILAHCPGVILVGWGNFAGAGRCGLRCQIVMGILGKPIYCLARTKIGMPAHPLYLPGNSKPVEYITKEEQM